MSDQLDRIIAGAAASSYDFVACRTLGHAFEPDEANRLPQIGYYLQLRCTRCGTVRTEEVDTYGNRLRPLRYKPLPEYKAAAQPRSVWRAEYLNRLTRRNGKRQ